MKQMYSVTYVAEAKSYKPSQSYTKVVCQKHKGGLTRSLRAFSKPAMGRQTVTGIVWRAIEVPDQVVCYRCAQDLLEQERASRPRR